MFNRKVLFIALLAVVLLTTFMDGVASVEKRHRIKPRAVVMNTISADDMDNYQARLVKPRQPRKKMVSGDPNQAAAGILANDPDAFQARLVKPRQPRKKMDFGDMNQFVGGAKMIDPSGRLG